VAGKPPPPPFTRTKRTRRVPHPVLIGHAASLSQAWRAAHSSRRTPRKRRRRRRRSDGGWPRSRRSASVRARRCRARTTSSASCASNCAAHSGPSTRTRWRRAPPRCPHALREARRAVRDASNLVTTRLELRLRAASCAESCRGRSDGGQGVAPGGWTGLLLCVASKASCQRPGTLRAAFLCT